MSQLREMSQREPTADETQSMGSCVIEEVQRAGAMPK